MTRILRLVCIAALISVPIAVSAQTLVPFDNLNRRIDVDDRVRIQDQASTTTTGRVITLTKDAIVISTPQGEKRFTSETAREIVLDRRLTKRGTLWGLGIGFVAGAAATCHEDCDIGMVFGAGLGAATGAIIGRTMIRPTTVYRSPQTQALIVPVVSQRRFGIAAHLSW